MKIKFIFIISFIMLTAATAFIIGCENAGSKNNDNDKLQTLLLAGASGAVSCSGGTVCGTVSGLTGSGLVLQNNGGDDLAIPANGKFSFATTIATGANYAVTVKTQPANPVQYCGVSNGSGTMASTITGVAISCSTGASGSTWSGTSSVTVSNSSPTYNVNAQVTWVKDTLNSTATVSVYRPEGTLTLAMLLAGLTITPSSYTLAHADGTLSINSSTNPSTYSLTLTPSAWSATWSSSGYSWTGPAGGMNLVDVGSTTLGGKNITGTYKPNTDLTYTYSFTGN